MAVPWQWVVWVVLGCSIWLKNYFICFYTSHFTFKNHSIYSNYSLPSGITSVGSGGLRLSGFWSDEYFVCWALFCVADEQKCKRWYRRFSGKPWLVLWQSLGGEWCEWFWAVQYGSRIILFVSMLFISPSKTTQSTPTTHCHWQMLMRAKGIGEWVVFGSMHPYFLCCVCPTNMQVNVWMYTKLLSDLSG